MNNLRGRRLSDNCKFVLQNVFDKDPSILVYITLQAVFAAGLPFIQIFIPSKVLQYTTGNVAGYTMIWQVGFLSVIFALGSYTQTYLSYTIDSSLIKHRIYYMDIIMNRWMETDLCNIESQSGINKFLRAKNVLFNDNTGAYGMLKTSGSLLGTVISLIVYTSIIFSISPILFLAICLPSVLHIVIINRVNRYEYEHREEIAQIDHRINYITERIKDYRYSKDIKMYSMQDWLLSKLEYWIEDRILWTMEIAKHESWIAVMPGCMPPSN